MSFSRREVRQLGSVDKVLYELGLVALGIMIAAVLLYFCTGISVLRIKFPCMFYRITKLPCPGCGGTRSLRALVHGDILLSMYMYFPLCYVVLVYVIFMVRCFLYRHFGLSKSRDGAIVKYIYIFVALLFLQWIVKLVAQLGFGYYWLWEYDKIFGYREYMGR